MVKLYIIIIEKVMNKNYPKILNTNNKHIHTHTFIKLQNYKPGK